MVETRSKELITIRKSLSEFLEDFLNDLHEGFITTLLSDIVEIVHTLFLLRESAKLYKHHIKKVIFERIAKNEEIVHNWNQRPLLWLRDEIFAFLLHHRFIIENIPGEVDQIRTNYELGSKAISLRFSLMSDEEKIKTIVSNELYDLLEQEGIATYNNMEDIVFLNTLSIEELEKSIEEIGRQKTLFEDEILLVDSFLANISFNEESISKIQEKKQKVESYLITFTLSEKLHGITLKIKKDSNLSREIDMEQINEKMNDLYPNSLLA